MKKVKVNGIKHDYTAFIKNNSFQEIGSLLENYVYKNYIVIYDSKVNIDPLLELSLDKEILEVDVDEKLKGFTGAEAIINFFNQSNVYKSSTLVIVIGGGVLLDLVGFVASIYKRGIDVAYVPTTLMAMLDVAIGSKTAIHFNDSKNLLGTLNDPVFSLIDPFFLSTLPKREIKSGLAEAIKMAYIANDKVLLLLDDMYDYNYNWEPLIFMCLNLKNNIISMDFEDKGVRKFLNFGHTFGHALEAYYDYEKYNHGEAVAIGMCLAYPHPKLLLDLQKYDISTEMDYQLDHGKLFNIMRGDKKNTTDDKISIITLEKECTPTFDTIDSEFDLFKKIERLKLINEELKK